MRVTHQDDHVTHAVLSGNQTQNMGISDSAEFFHILSSSLYQNQRLAVIREVLCNGWDAHIDSGREAMPLKITLDDTNLIIQDSGPGISPEDFGPIYGVYGHSTKKADGKQTGGFGLGCKSPFAYTDHFEVTSCHKGVKTVYALSKSSAEAEGKPGITPIVSLPCDEHGITVKIKLKAPAQDRNIFTQYIKEVVRNGEIFATLNGTVLPIFPFSKSESNFITLNDAPVQHGNYIYLRYGNVIYPVDAHADYLASYKAIHDFMCRIGRRLVLLAPPHSISVTPSRESLSMQEKTIKTLTELLAGFVEVIKRQPVLEKKMIPEIIEEIAKQDVARLLNTNRLTHSLIEKPEPQVTLGLSELTRISLCSSNNRPNGLIFYKDFRKRALKFTSVKSDHKERILALLKIANKKTPWRPFGRSFNRDGLTTDTHWIQKSLLRNVIRGIAANKNLHLDRLRVHGYRGYHYDSEKILNLEAMEVKQCLKFYDTPILLGTSLKTLERYTGRRREFVSYVCGNQKAQIEAAREFFKNSGFEIVDLIVDRVAPIKSDKPKVKTEKVVGIPLLSNVLFDGDFDTTKYDRKVRKKSDMPRITDPKYVVQISKSGRNESNHIDEFRNEFDRIIRMFGDNCGICSNSRQIESYEKKGAVRVNQVVRDFFMKELLYASNIRRYFEINPLSREADIASEFLSAALGFESVSSLFNAKVELNQYEHDMVQIILNNRDYQQYIGLQEAITEICKIPPHPMYEFFVSKIRKSGITDVIDWSTVHRASMQYKSEPSRQLTEELLLNILTN